jgi:hypothetical protein
MNKIQLVGFSLLCGLSGAVAANCTIETAINDLQTLLPGKTVCATYGTDQWQEYHALGGDLIDYKQGPPAPGNVDPTETVGTWSISDDKEKVTYSYTGGDSYTYTVHAEGNDKYSFCNGSTQITGATLKPNQVSCP